MPKSMHRATNQQQPSPMPIHRYTLFPPVGLPDRTWPERAITTAPRWLSTDLRDGNQALIDPMDLKRKLIMFELLVRMGYKEIEIGFPSASKTDFDFARQLIEEDHIPDDVQISVLTPAREPLIERTAWALAGARRATVHILNATPPLYREVVFGVDRNGCKDIAVRGTHHVMKFAEQILSGCDVGFEYTPEVFVDTELDFALEVCDAVTDVWQPDAEREIVLNLPATIERSTPNIYADQIEWMGRHLSRREHVALSVHPHNDRGTAVAAAELAVMAGADRIEGCLFGNGERTGNVDLVTLGMNLFSQGIDPQIDFSDIDDVRRTVEYCNQIPLHPRHPYAGDLVYTSFSGSHQDAIKKGFDALSRQAEAAGVPVGQLRWALPYLPIDPKDVGRTYEAVIRVNSQSGKGGMAYLIKAERGMDLPRRLQIEFAGVVQEYTDRSGGEVTSSQLCRVFDDEYVCVPDSGLGLLAFRQNAAPGDMDTISADIRLGDVVREISGTGKGPIPAFVAALATVDVHVEILDYSQHAISAGNDAQVAAYAECAISGAEVTTPVWGVAVDASSTLAVLRAICAAVNRNARGASSALDT
jgi:2-isopropylmalate synthase